jgi:hypothetical protein
VTVANKATHLPSDFRFEPLAVLSSLPEPVELPRPSAQRRSLPQRSSFYTITGSYVFTTRSDTKRSRSSQGGHHAPLCGRRTSVCRVPEPKTTASISRHRALHSGVHANGLTCLRYSVGHLTKCCSQPLSHVIHTYEIRPRKDHRAVDLISDALPFGGLWYAGPHASSNAIGYGERLARVCRRGTLIQFLLKIS